MRHASRILSLIALVSAVGMVEGATTCLHQPVAVVDLHKQWIGVWNLEEKVGSALSILASASSSCVSIDLSSNVIRDEDILTLIEILQSHNLMAKILGLNLSNNRLTWEGINLLIPLLASDKFQWLDVSANNMMIDDFRQLWEEISKAASCEVLRDQWAAKVVLLSRDYDPKRALLAQPFVDAHRRYYFSSTYLLEGE
ncbi:hypothetical protein [Candidatus Bodocaedibacter vickermanii]|uniref:Leucine Rich repeats (2 copies) n=1 Tax=Candidatus Bodocaedibacter vickermanii TaxID=2741701 RepID=A0A7L9RSJ7_9PROT|nr:hypothetical protein CPBP_00306 [Candidatus Paracaedibacteraceae bacterium 'Lake Konstanz']